MSSFITNTTLGQSAGPRRVTLWAQVTAMLAARRQRAQLRDLDDHMLQDLGINRAEAEAESRRAPWDVPATWRQRS